MNGIVIDISDSFITEAIHTRGNSRAFGLAGLGFESNHQNTSSDRPRP